MFCVSILCFVYLLLCFRVLFLSFLHYYYLWLCIHFVWLVVVVVLVGKLHFFIVFCLCFVLGFCVLFHFFYSVMARGRYVIWWCCRSSCCFCCCCCWWWCIPVGYMQWYCVVLSPRYACKFRTLEIQRGHQAGRLAVGLAADVLVLATYWVRLIFGHASQPSKQPQRSPL